MMKMQVYMHPSVCEMITITFTAGMNMEKPDINPAMHPPESETRPRSRGKVPSRICENTW